MPKHYYMQLTLKYIKRTNELFVQLVEELSLEELTTIPQGFSNNIVWNFGHAVVTLSALAYLRSDIQPGKEVPFFKQYAKGTRPDHVVTPEEVEALKALAFTAIGEVEKDIPAGVFENITPFATSTFAFEMDSIDEILTCVLAHTGLHYGYALAIKKAVIRQKA